MAVEFVPKPPSRLQAVRGRWVIVWPVVLLIVAGSAYAGLAYYESVLNTQIKGVDEKIQQVETGRDVSAEEKVLTLEAQLTTLEDVMKNHIYFSKFLAGLELLVHPQAYLKSFSINVPTRKFDVSGEAASFTILAKQILAVSKSPNIEKVEIGGLSLSGEGRVGFTLGVTYKPEFIQTAK
ncbi:TPA: hypothetical protein DCP13_03375 [Candidatus Azambacteria bacterium]|uniref:Fimbrial assembly family protein n=5 Tax=Candidatus Azamiibacteriota TaxID=1752741 RepID=A0A0G1SCB1_9BACT